MKGKRMLRKGKQILLSLLAVCGFLLSACGEAGTQDPSIGTAVAQTVAAQGAATITPTPAALPAETSSPSITLTPAPTRIPPTLSQSSKYAACTQANLISETIPDGTIMAPGQQFTKIWQIQNNSTCTWDTSYKIVFWDGDVMGGAYIYNFPQSAIPGQIMDVPLVLIAPETNGPFASYWMFQTPDGANFGVGEYSQPVYTEIVVSDAKKPDYGVLSVSYEIVRDPPTGCPRNSFYTVYATITANGPVEVNYYWAQSDGNDSGIKTMLFKEAGSQTISREWKVGLGDSPNDRWMQIIVTGPEPMEYEKAVWSNPCP
jgi:hypothetical protein